MKWLASGALTFVLVLSNMYMWIMTYKSFQGLGSVSADLGATYQNNASDWAFGSCVFTIASALGFTAMVVWLMFVEKDTRKFR